MYGSSSLEVSFARRESRRAAFRIAIAGVLASFAAIAPWPDPIAPPGCERVEWLAPRGRLDAPPRRVCFRGAAGADRLRLIVRDEAGRRALDRTFELRTATDGWSIPSAERKLIEALGSGEFVLQAIGEDGALLGTSAPARFLLDRSGERR